MLNSKFLNLIRPLHNGKTFSVVHFYQCQQPYDKKEILIILPLFRKILKVILPFQWNFKVIVNCDTLCNIVLRAHLFTISPKPKWQHHTSLSKVIWPCLSCSDMSNEKCQGYSLIYCSEIVVNIKKVIVLNVLLQMLSWHLCSTLSYSGKPAGLYLEAEILHRELRIQLKFL